MNRRSRLQFLILTISTIIATFLFSNDKLDFAAANLFYSAQSADVWPEQSQPLWQFFYFAAPALTGILVLGSLGVMFLSMWKRRFNKYRIYSIFVFLVVILGPGLLINSVFKPFWGRPRPRHIVEFKGHESYRPFYQPAVGQPGKSFPCGHCSAGYAYGLFGFILQSQPVLATTVFVSSVALGLLMGVGRIAAGGHFFSDVIWSGLITYWLAYFLYYYILNIPVREKQNVRQIRVGKRVIFAYSMLAILTVLILLIASPFNKNIGLSHNASGSPSIRLYIEKAAITIQPSNNSLEVSGKAKGFGFPKSKVNTNCTGTANVECHIRTSGFFSDYESQVTLKINLEKYEKFEIINAGGTVIKNALPNHPKLSISNPN